MQSFPSIAAINWRGILTDDDVETLKHLAAQGMGDITPRALASDSPISRPGALQPPGSPYPGLHRKTCSRNSWRIISGTL